MEPGAKLHGLDVTFTHVRYDWRQTDPLAARTSSLDLERRGLGGIVGGRPVRVTGATTENRRQSAGASRVRKRRDRLGHSHPGRGPAAASPRPSFFATIPRTLAVFEALAARAGWAVNRSIVVPAASTSGCADLLRISYIPVPHSLSLFSASPAIPCSCITSTVSTTRSDMNDCTVLGSFVCVTAPQSNASF